MAHTIKAKTYSDDHNVETEFDAVHWFTIATDTEILNLAECGWGGDYAADAVAQWSSDINDKVAAMFSYVATIQDDPAKKDVCGYECHVDADDAMAWLKDHRPHLYEQVKDK